ncbi:MAG: phosphoribosyl-AMP cyclohydrolase [Armatimonadetes bacterium]|nr:phosphoribosyl-AMP cyclohydrolase [Armatimonadota bacterium]
MGWIEGLKFDANGLIPAIVQDAQNGDVLMLAYMNAESIRRTLETRRATYWSRSRQEYWVKGATSGHIQQVKEIRIDCDQDALLIMVDQTGPACHENYRSCFFRTADGDELKINSEKQGG